MKIIFLLVAIMFILESCGKKSEPKYQSKIKQENINIL
jgi:hypothetical protein